MVRRRDPDRHEREDQDRPNASGWSDRHVSLGALAREKNCNGVRVTDWNDMIGENRLEIFYGHRKLTETSIEVK